MRIGVMQRVHPAFVEALKRRAKGRISLVELTRRMAVAMTRYEARRKKARR